MVEYVGNIIHDRQAKVWCRILKGEHEGKRVFGIMA
jgi:hypothetical protein